MRKGCASRHVRGSSGDLAGCVADLDLEPPDRERVAAVAQRHLSVGDPLAAVGMLGGKFSVADGEQQMSGAAPVGRRHAEAFETRP